MRICAVVLAAGQGKRMRSSIPKVLHKVAGRPMIEHVCGAAFAAGADKVVAVLSPDAPEVARVLGPGVAVAWQDAPLGTGDAALRALPELEAGDLVLVLCGDTPLLQPATLRSLGDRFLTLAREDARVCGALVTSQLDDPTGYGRIVRGPDQGLLAIVEQGDATEAQRGIREINAGIYCFPAQVLQAYLPRLSVANAQAEYQVTDIVRLAINDGRLVGSIPAPAEEVIGINSRDRLAVAEGIFRRRTLDALMLAGVTIIDPSSTYVDADVAVGQDTTIWPQTYLLQGTVVGQGCDIGPGAHLRAASLGDRVTVTYSTVEESAIGNDVTVGPYAHLRPANVLADGVRVGNYAELKNSRIGPGTKISHHSYVGDADIGAGVNIGAGVVFVNYDGEEKHRSVLEDGAFIGCNANLVSPVEVGARGYVAAGSTVTERVPPGSLAIARARQANIEGWVDRRHPGRRAGAGGQLAGDSTEDKLRGPHK